MLKIVKYYLDLIILDHKKYEKRKTPHLFFVEKKTFVRYIILKILI